MSASVMASAGIAVSVSSLSMIAEISARHRASKMFVQIAQQMTGRGDAKKPRGSFLSPIISKLRAKK